MLIHKLFRDIKKNFSQFLAIFLMVTIGLMAYSGINAYMLGMEETADRFYTENNLQDLNVVGANFTNDDLAKIKSLDHVKNAERKLEFTDTTTIDGEEKTLLMSAIESNEISKFYIFEGEEFDKEKSGLWLDNYFAVENNLKVGDKLAGKKILALINVPDHLYDVRDETELYPNRQKFGFAYVSSKELPAEIFTTIMVDVDDKANVNAVKSEILNHIKNATAVVNIEDTTSYSAYQEEIDEGKTYVGVFSGIFLFIAILSVTTTMTRIVKNQRTEIGTLKALGFSNGRIMLHYTSYGTIVSVLAGALGILLGYFLIGNYFLAREMDFFEIPNGTPGMDPTNIPVAVGVVLIIALASLIVGRSILKESPAEALRLKPAKLSVKKDHFNGKFTGKLSFVTKWNLRDISRNRLRTLMGLVGVISCAALIVCAFGMLDTINHFIDLQFSDICNFAYKINLESNISPTELDDLKTKYGDKTSRTLAIELSKDENLEMNNLFVSDAGDYYRFIDGNDQIVALDSKDGVYMTRKRAELDGYKIGDTVRWHIIGSDTYYESEIIGFNKDPQNQNLTATPEYLKSLGVDYYPDAIYTNENLENAKTPAGVSSIQGIESIKSGMEDMLSTMKSLLVILIAIAVVLGAVIIYNLGILSFTEKEYQFATLKVLGLTDFKIKKIFIVGNLWISLFATALGLPAGYLLTDYLFKSAIGDTYDFGAYILPATYVIAAAGSVAVTMLVSIFLARKIKKIDMVKSLKADE